MPKKQPKNTVLNDESVPFFDNPIDLESQSARSITEEELEEEMEESASDVSDERLEEEIEESPEKSLAELFAELNDLLPETEKLAFEFNYSQTHEEAGHNEEEDLDLKIKSESRSEMPEAIIPKLTPEELKKLRVIHWELAIKAVTGGDKETLSAVLNPKLQITEIEQEHTQLQIQLHEIQNSVMFIQRQKELLKEYEETDKSEDKKNSYQSQINGVVDYVIQIMRAKYVDYYRHQKLDIEVVSKEGEELRIKEKLLTDEKRQKLVEKRIAQLRERLATTTVCLDLINIHEKIEQAIEILNKEEEELLDHEKAYLEGIEKLTKRMSYLFFSSNSAYLSTLRKEGINERLPKVVQDALHDEKLEAFEQIKQAYPCLVSPTAKTSSGNNLLHLALACHQSEIATILLRYGVSPIERNESGAVPLIIAIDDEDYRFVDEAIDILRARKLITSKEYDQNYIDVIHRKAELQEEESELKRQFKDLWQNYHENNEAQEALKRLKKVVKGMKIEVIERRKALYEYGVKILGRAETMGHDTRLVEFAERLSYEEQYRGKQRFPLLTRAEARKLDELVKKSRAVDHFAKLGEVQEQAVMAIKAIVDSVETTMALRVQLTEEIEEYQTEIRKEREKLRTKIQEVTERKDKIIAEKDAEIAKIREQSAIDKRESDEKVAGYQSFIESQTEALEKNRKESAEYKAEAAKAREESAEFKTEAAVTKAKFDKLEKDIVESKAETAGLKEQFNQMQQMMFAMMQGGDPQQLAALQQQNAVVSASGAALPTHAMFFRPISSERQANQASVLEQKPESSKDQDLKGKRKSDVRPKK